MTDPDLHGKPLNHLQRVKYGRGKRFRDAPQWNDTVLELDTAFRRRTSAPFTESGQH